MTYDGQKIILFFLNQHCIYFLLWHLNFWPRFFVSIFENLNLKSFWGPAHWLYCKDGSYYLYALHLSNSERLVFISRYLWWVWVGKFQLEPPGYFNFCAETELKIFQFCSCIMIWIKFMMIYLILCRTKNVLRVE